MTPAEQVEIWCCKEDLQNNADCLEILEDSLWWIMSTSNQDLDHSHGDAGHDELHTQEEDQLSSGINIFRNIVVVEVPGELLESEDLAESVDTNAWFESYFSSFQ